MAKPHRIELSLRDTAAADPAFLVRASTSPDFSEDVRRRSILRRACRSVPVFPPAPVEDHRRMGHHPLSVAHRGNWELHILQPADNCPVRPAIRRSPFAEILAGRAWPVGRIEEWPGGYRSRRSAHFHRTASALDDGQDWKTYEFKFKPGDVTQPPRWTAPYQPRLDWQMWFAALSNYQSNPWFSQLMLRLLQGSPEVLGLLATNPFPGKPPRFIRAVVYDYHFSDFATRRSTGAWWTRRELGAYFPAVSLR